MAITQNISRNFLQEILVGTHNLTVTTGDTIKMALYLNTATLDNTYATYDATSDEVANGNGYTTGGITLTSVTPVLSGSTAICDFSDAVWTSATFSTGGALIYNSSQGNKSIAVLGFGGEQSITGGTLTVEFPTADASNAIIRIT